MPLNYATYAVPRADLREAILEFDPTTAGFITTEILPIKGVKRKAATLSVMVRENLKRVDTKHANGSAYNRFRTKLEDKAYACENHGLEEPLTDKTAPITTTISTRNWRSPCSASSGCSSSRKSARRR